MPDDDFQAIGGGRTRGRLNVPMGAHLPPEYGQAMFEQLEGFRQRQEQEQSRRFLEGINALGRLHTGSALRGGHRNGPGAFHRAQGASYGGNSPQGG